MNYSQLGQDLEVVKFYNHMKDGYFIEIGALDGIEISNTYLLEKTYNWKGICVEPIPYRFEKLVSNRPNSICVNKAVYDKSNKNVVFDIANNGDGLSGISEVPNLDWHKNLVNANKTQIMVETISLNDLLEQSNSPTFINYLSLDTEGSEYDILKTFNFSKYTIGLIDVEHNFTEPRRSNIRNLLLNNGYIYMRENYVDDCYIHSSLIRKPV